jgi:Protein of unknown function (DUF2628)
LTAGRERARSGHPKHQSDGVAREEPMEDNPYQAPEFTQEREIALTSLSEAEIRAFVGRNAKYYLRKWSAPLGDFAQATGFNWAAFLLSGFWILYRRMYRVALIAFSIVAVPAVVTGIPEAAGLADQGTIKALNAVGNLCGFAFAIVCGNFGNAWYLAHTKRQIAQVRELGLAEEAYLRALARRGGTSFFGALGLFALFLVAIYIVLVIVFLIIALVTE